MFVEFCQRLQIMIIGVEAFGRLASRPLDFGLAQPRLYGAGDIARNLVLQFENVIEGAVEAVGPDVRAASRVDQLSSDAHAVAGLADAAFEHVAHAQFARDLLQVDGAALVRKTRIARDHEATATARSRS